MGNPAKRLIPSLVLLLLFCAPYGRAGAQVPASLSDSAHIEVITVSPGQAVYNMFGHSAIRVVDDSQRLDIVFNYGTFDFVDPMFVPRFVGGRLDYFLSVARSSSLVRGANLEGRSVVAQRLNLDQAQRAILYRNLIDNAQPENRQYRYDFLMDNCATRILDQIELATGRVLLVDRLDSLDNPDLDPSFRHLLDRYLGPRPWLHAGIDLVLGSPTDRASSPRSAAFLPDYLFSTLADAQISDSGGRRPLVARVDTLLAPSATGSSSAFPWPLALSVVLALAMGALHWASLELQRRVDRIFFGLLGVVGTFLLLMWIATAHSVTAWNVDLLWALPLHLGLAFSARWWSSRGYWAVVLSCLIAAAVLGGIMGALHPVAWVLMIGIGFRSLSRLIPGDYSDNLRTSTGR